MMPLTNDALTQHLELADVLVAGRDRMIEPQDLPGQYGRVVRALDRVLAACDCEAVVGGGWAMWRHGYLGAHHAGRKYCVAECVCREIPAIGVI